MVLCLHHIYTSVEVFRQVWKIQNHTLLTLNTARKASVLLSDVIYDAYSFRNTKDHISQYFQHIIKNTEILISRPPF